MTNPIWDLNVNLREFKKVLKNPRDARFEFFLSRVLSRVPFYHAFHGFITPHQFKKYYPKVRHNLDADLLGAGRLFFWDWLHKKIKLRQNRRSLT